MMGCSAGSGDGSSNSVDPDDISNYDDENHYHYSYQNDRFIRHHHHRHYYHDQNNDKTNLNNIYDLNPPPPYKTNHCNIQLRKTHVAIPKKRKKKKLQ